jgi:hypothetical protein
MSKSIEYLPGARTDFDESFDWYAERDSGAALGFALSVDAALESVQIDPARLPKTAGNCHYCLLK